jgi:zinc protease
VLDPLAPQVSLLPSGLTVATVTLAGSRAVHLQVAFDYGSAHQQPGQEGWAHLLEHLHLSNDSGAAESVERLSQIKAYSADFDAYTGADTTAYTVHAPRRYWESVSRLMARAISKPTLTAEAIAAECAIVAQESSIYEADPTVELVYAVARLAYAGTPYAGGLAATAGSVESLRTADPPGLAAFRARGYVNRAARVIAVGAISHAETIDFAGQLDLGSGPAPLAPMGEWRPDFEPARIVVNRRGPSRFVVAWPTVSADDQRSPLLDMLEMWLGRDHGSPFYDGLRRSGIAYSPTTAHGHVPGAGSLELWVETSDASRIDEAVDLIRAVVRDGPEALTEERVARIRSEAVGQLEMRSDNPTQLLGRLSSTASASAGRIVGIDEQIAHINAVTRGQLLETWREFLTPDRFIFVRQEFIATERRRR